MKRDLDLIREILIKIEAKESSLADKIIIEGYDQKIVDYQILLLRDAGFLHAFVGTAPDLVSNIVMPMRLTWEGHEFLDNARNETVWKKTKSTLGEKALTVSVSIISELMKSIIKGSLGL